MPEFTESTAWRLVNTNQRDLVCAQSRIIRGNPLAQYASAMYFSPFSLFPLSVLVSAPFTRILLDFVTVLRLAFDTPLSFSLKNTNNIMQKLGVRK